MLGPVVILAAFTLVGCTGNSVPPDEALARVRAGNEGYGSGGEFANLGPGTSAEDWQKAAMRYYPPAYHDYFEDMDRMGTPGGTGTTPLRLSASGVKGRNAWVMWTAGNEAWWDWLSRYGYGTIDLLRLIDHTDRDTRFARTGLMNEPNTRPPEGDETDKTHGVRYARPITEGPPERIHVERRTAGGRTPPDPKVYGYPTGVVGLRLFPNPEFEKSAAAQKRWKDNLALYYGPEKDENTRKYLSHPDTIRPFRVGMSCGFCHIAPHPLNPPADPERPEWANLSSNIGNQYMRIRAVFGNRLQADNYLYHAFDSQLPGAVDTSGYPSDNINNPNTINSFFSLRGRVERAGNNPRETLSRDSLDYLHTYVDNNQTNPQAVPRVLLDGSDSVGVHIALSRVYLNIGTHHQQWIRVQNPILGFRPQSPFKLRDVAENSLYWHATLLRIIPMRDFFLESTDPMRLKDTPDEAVKKSELRGTGVPWYTTPQKDEKPGALPVVGDATKDYSAGRAAFAKGCIACHSSVQPGDSVYLERTLTANGLPPLGPLPDDWNAANPADPKKIAAALAGRAALRLTAEDRARLTRGDGELPEGYRRWAEAAVHRPEFWEHKQKVSDAGGPEREVVVHNFLSTDERIPVTITRTNSARAVATNARHGHVWEDFASETYKELDGVGPIHYRDPISGAEKAYTPPGGGPGYYRVPTLISIWATAPFLHNNSLGHFNNDPSVKGRVTTFDDGIRRLLSPERRAVPSTQHYWDGENPDLNTPDAWYPGREAGKPGVPEKAADQRALDGGWIWRTTKTSSLMFDGPHVPRLVGGVVGIDDFWMGVLPWAPALVFLVLGLLLLCGESVVRFRQRALGRFRRLLNPLRWLFGVGGFALAVLSVYLVITYWPLVTLLDVGTLQSIPLLRTQAVVLPAVLFVAFGLHFVLDWLPDGRGRVWLARTVGVFCLLLSVLTAVGIGPFLAGRASGVKVGPIPEGIPINLLANINPELTREQKTAVLDALTKFLLKHQPGSPAPANPDDLRKEFEATVGPALRDASKCPDFVTDRGHDYVFIRRLSDAEKDELIALLKTF